MKAITSDHLRKFYYSNRYIKEKRTRELQTRKIKDMIWATEKRFVKVEITKTAYSTHRQSR
jgi:hypothetical protein